MSGAGRVVWNLYDECFELWSGSPAVQCLIHGLETESVIDVDNSNMDSTSEFIASTTDEIIGQRDDSDSDDESCEPLLKKMKSNFALVSYKRYSVKL